MEEFEVLVIGGGPAGLSAALYLARYDRRTALFDSGHGRSTGHQIIHNYMGFPGGVAARQLRELGCQQLADYPRVTTYYDRVHAIRRDGDIFIAEGQTGEEWRGHAVILCTGVEDHYPQFDGWEEYIGRSMFWCITCDGYGCKGARVVVVGNTNAVASEALQLTRFTDQLTVLTNSDENHIEEKFKQRLEKYHIPLIHDTIQQVVGSNGQFEELITCQGHHIQLDQLFNQQGATPRIKLANDLGVKLGDLGYIETDTEQKTSVPGVFAAGDVTRLFSQQVSTAVHEGGQAASAANYYLYPPDLKDD